MPMGDEEKMGEVIIFESVTRHYEGTYECVIEDDYGFEPITREVQLHVEFNCLHNNADQLKIAISHFRCPSPQSSSKNKHTLKLKLVRKFMSHVLSMHILSLK